ncbi:MAG: PDZ domain-containing protein [Gemmataceae bacterium]|nr:PDZ domain-containing protein [Gemmataceae bacterium]
MLPPMRLLFPILAAGLGLCLTAPVSGQDRLDVNEANEEAMRAAAATAAPAVVKIETAGGLEVVGTAKKGGPPGGGGGPGVARGTGPTTGLVVDPDGYVITSSFNFANKPTDIFVTVPGRPNRLVAKVVATDQTRMLTLLKVEAKELQVPAAYPKKEVRVGQWALSLGRTLDPDVGHLPSISAGIVSATGRLLGKALQTDAKVSPANYGGPLVAIDGRVLGVLVPASVRSEGETAGFEWYDSGIGFAIPLEDVLAKLSALKGGKDLRRGLLGINPKDADAYTAKPVIGAVGPDSAAARAGIKVGDTIVSIDGKPTPNFSSVQHALGPKYEGDAVTVQVLRDGKEVEFAKIELQGTQTAYVNPFFGVLPLRDDPAPGVPVRFVYPDSPAAAAGLKEGDRVMKVGTGKTLAPVRNRTELATALSQFPPGSEVTVEVKRKEGDKTETLTAKLTTVPDAVPAKLPMPSSAGKALEGRPKEKGGLFPKGGKEPEPEKKTEKEETGYIKRTDEALGREHWLYVPDSYDPNVSHGLIVWFHPVGQGGKDGERMAAALKEFCETHHYILMGPKSANPEGWAASETELVVQDVRKVLGRYTIDPARVVAHGMGNGGQMAFYLGFQARDLFRGVAAVGSALGTAPKENVANQPLAFFVAAGDKDPLLNEVKASKDALAERRFPVVYREVKDAGKEYLDAEAFEVLLNWLDSLDRM